MANLKHLMFLIVGFMLCHSVVMAQTIRTPQVVTGDDVEIKIKKFKLQVINYDDNYPSLPGLPSGRKLKFLMFLIEYEWDINKDAQSRFRRNHVTTSAYFIDKLNLAWHVLLAQGAGGKAVKPSKYGYDLDTSSSIRANLKITYSNVENDGTHYAVLFISGRDIARYYKRFASSNVFTQVVFRVGDKEVARLAANGQAYAVALPQDGEKGLALLDKYLPRRRKGEADLHFSDRIPRVKGILIPKSQSPWALSQWDIFDKILAVSEE